ncbi:hypothetical protein [Paraburkholderia bannensis]|uniref:hypothetical protein n=1 Tax=Paraburkholderia bannensis TaxID=765414 RepID=UPI002AB66CED|nr:hypothetical protein [Paraburkholderia bannensis]
MVIRCHPNRFWFQLTPRKVRRPRNPLSITSTARTTRVVPLRISGWLLQNDQHRPNRIGVARHADRRERKRIRQQLQPRLRITIKTQSRLFLPRRRRIHDVPLR